MGAEPGLGDRAACALAMNHPGSSEGCGPWAPTAGSSLPISVSQALDEARRGLWTLHVDPDVSMGYGCLAQSVGLWP